MAWRANNASGDYSSATIWETNSNTPTLHATTNITLSTGTYFTTTFTAPNTTNAATRVIFIVPFAGSAGTITVTLQENSAGWVDRVGASASYAVTSLTANTHACFQLTIPYVFTATTAGYYRYKIVAAGMGGTTRFAADSGGSLSAFVTYDSRVGALGATDDTTIVGSNGTNNYTIKISDTSASWGSGTSTAIATDRSWGNGVVIGLGGTLNWSTTASSTLTLLGSLVKAGGTLGSVTAIPRAYTAQLIFNENGATCNYGINIATGALSKCYLQGDPLTTSAGTYKSGAGTAASPLLTNAALDFVVGQEIWVAPTEGYSQGENKFVKTVNSTTSIVISDTVGGAESALANSHDNGADLVIVSRNFVIKTTNTAEGFYLTNNVTTVGNVDFDWVRFENVGSNLTGKNSIYLAGTSSSTCTADNCVLYNNLYIGFNWAANPQNKTYTNLWSGFNKTNNTSGSYCFQTNSTVKLLNLTGCMSLEFGRSGWNLTGAGNIISICKAIANSQQNSANYGFLFSNMSGTDISNLESYSNRGYGVGIASISGDFVNAQIGIKGSNDAGDIYCFADTYNDTTFFNSNFGSANFVLNYTNMVSGSKVNFHNKNDATLAHFSYTAEGINQSTGTGLDDATVITAGTYNTRMSPESLSPGDSVRFKLLARAGKAVQCFGKAQMNAALSGDAGATAVVNLYLPLSTTPDYIYTLTKTTSAQVWSVFANYPGTVDEYATVEINVKSTTASAYMYVGDILNGTNNITAQNLWEKGQMSPIMFEQLGDSAAVWAVLTATLTTDGTIGYFIIKKLLTVGKFLGLK